MNTTVMVQLPSPLYQQLASVAKRTNQAIADILIATATASLAVDNDELPPDLAAELKTMHFLSDQALWTATQPTLSPEQQTQFSYLSALQKEQSLTTAQANQLNQFLAEYDYSVLRRAQAFAILTARGHKIPDLNERPRPI